MVLSETWQLPAVDDIDPDSLEYLFGAKRPKPVDTPWVKLARDAEPVARISPEMIRLQAKLEVLLMQVDLLTGKLQNAHDDIGYARAQLAEKDEQLRLMAEYRARAAQAIIADVEREQMRERITQLERQLNELLHAERPAPLALPGQAAEDAAVLDVPEPQMSSTPVGNDMALDVRETHAARVKYIMPMMPFIYLLMVCFAGVILLMLIV